MKHKQQENAFIPTFLIETFFFSPKLGFFSFSFVIHKEYLRLRFYFMKWKYFSIPNPWIELNLKQKLHISRIFKFSVNSNIRWMSSKNNANGKLKKKRQTFFFYILQLQLQVLHYDELRECRHRKMEFYQM